MKRIGLHTLGCKLNFAETSFIGKQFVDRGFRVVEADQPADVYLLNTCSVTARADREARQIIRRMLRTSPDAYVIVVGCYAQLQPEEIASIDGVDLVLGAKEKFRIFEHVGSFQKNPYAKILVSDVKEAAEFAPAFSSEVGNRTRAFLKIQDGCDYVCSFCTVPLARGASRSASVEEILRQAEAIAERGYREIVLTGVNVGDYGSKIGTNLLALLQKLEDIGGIERIRISSIEPNLLTDEIIDYIVGSAKVCNHFHIPLQSGSDAILGKMRRRYRTREYSSLVEYIKNADADAAVGADVIVGFPGESHAHFEETYRFLVDLPISYLHVFSYSERPGTPASEYYEGAVDPRVRATRSKMLRILGQKKRHAFASQFIGQTMPVLFENSDVDRGASGLTRNYLRVMTRSTGDLVNQMRHVRIVELTGEMMVGTVQEAIHTRPGIVTVEKEMMI